MIKKILLPVIVAASLITSPVVAYANISESIVQPKIDSLSESEQKLFKILLDYSLDKAAELGYGAVCFEGNIEFYGKSGFFNL